MNRSGYNDGCDDNWSYIMYRGAVSAAVRGTRGQAFIAKALEVMNNMPSKELISGEFHTNGKYCLLGAVGAAQGINLDSLDYHDVAGLAKTFGIAGSLVREIMHENDECIWGIFQQDNINMRRWCSMKSWLFNNLKNTTTVTGDNT